MAFCRADLSLRHGKVGDTWRLQSGGRLDEHRHVEMLLEQIGGFDRLLVTPINEGHALAGEFDEGNFGRSFGCRSNLRRLGALLRSRKREALPGCRRRSADRRRPPWPGIARSQCGKADAPS